MSILGFLFFILIAIFVLGASILNSILRAIFGFGKRSNPSSNNTQSKETNQNENMADNSAKRKKLFDKNEGEYVEFEEVKDTAEDQEEEKGKAI